MVLDDAESIRRFLSQIEGQLGHAHLNPVTPPPTTQNDLPANEDGPPIGTADSKHTDKYYKSDGAKTPPGATVADQANYHLISPEAHPKPSPHVSGLKAPFNTPKTAASSPRLSAANTHNEDVAEAFSDYVNTLNTRPLSDSMWAPGSARYKPSILSGARSTNVLTPIKAVEPNPAINDTFDRMSFKVADPDPKTSESLIGGHVTRRTSIEPPPSFTNQFSVLADKTQEGEIDDAVEAKFEKASDEVFETPAQIQAATKAQKSPVKTDRADQGGFPDTAPTEGVGKENDAPSAPKGDLPPHLRAKRISSQKPIKTEAKAATDGNEPKVTPGLAGTKPLKGAESKDEDLEHKAIFTAWPTSEERSRPAAKVRKVVIKDLPRDSTANFVASLVYGGPIEEIQIRSSAAGHLSAAVRFMNAGDCMKFYEDTSNGLVYKTDAKGRELVLLVELSQDVDVIGGLLERWIASGVTRCVRAVGVESKWNSDKLVEIAERKNRKVEKVVDGQNAGGARSVVFRFCKVEDAVQFKGALSRDEDWEHCNIHYAADPCATASGVHLEG